MSKTRLAIAALFISFILVTIPTALCETPSTMDHIKVINEKDSGKTIVLKNEDEFCLILFDQPGARNFWDIQDAVLSDGLKIIKETDINLGQPGIVGGPAMHIVEIGTVNSGSQSLKINHWSMGTVDRIFKLKVIVKKDK
jgi:predicted secreted protein